MILVVDDDRATREYLVELLEFAGYHAEGAANGLEGFQRIESSDKPPDLILLDLLMPEMPGWGLLTRLEMDEKLARTPVVVLSGIEDKTAPPYENIVGRLNKPASASEILEMVGRIVKPPAGSSVHEGAEVGRMRASSSNEKGL